MNEMLGPREIVEEAADRWWIFLVTGIAWLVFALLVFQWDYTTVYAISILFGVVAMIAGLNEFMAISYGAHRPEFGLSIRLHVASVGDQATARALYDRILEAGQRAPSAGNWQPWDFVLVTDRAQLVELAKVWQGAKHVAGAAAAIAIVAPQPQDDRQSALLQYDLGQATYAMTVAAADLGVGKGHAAAADQDQARAVLGFPEGRFLA